MSDTTGKLERPPRRVIRILHVNPLAAGPFATWPALLAAAAAAGFSHVALPPPFAAADIRLLDDPTRPHPALAFDGDAAALLAALDSACRAAGLGWLLDVRLDAVAADGAVAAAAPDAFDRPPAWVALRPDETPQSAHLLANEQGAAVWAGLLRRWQDAGAAGFRLSGLAALPAAALAGLAGPLSGLSIGVPEPHDADLAAWRAAGLDLLELEVDRWDEQPQAVLDRAAALAPLAPLLASVERPFGPRLAARHPTPAERAATAARILHVAAALGDAVMVPMGFATGDTLRADPRAATGAEPLHATPPAALFAALPAAADGLGPPRPVPSPAAGVAGLLRRSAQGARLTLSNGGARPVSMRRLDLVRGYAAPAETETGMSITLAPGQARSLDLAPLPFARTTRQPRDRAAAEPAAAPRLAIEAVSPAVDAGRFAAKRVAGELVAIECDILCDGHDQLAAMVQWRPVHEAEWRETPLLPLGNDRWQAAIELAAVGRWLFRIAAWRDAFATYRDELGKKSRAGLNISLEIREGVLKLQEAAAREPSIAQAITRIADAPPAEQTALLLGDELAASMRRADPRPFQVQSPVFPIDADRSQAAFAAWYEIFPRSMSGDPARHGTFRDVIAQLPRIRDMGFDVLYFPPIHPIGRVNRKGRNNSLTPAADDPGSPYAIGTTEGGHDALHPELGGFDDFEALRLAAAEAGLELAMDFAVQCAPDHPWLTEHRDWFDWRPDGSLRYAENPPKKYEDIVNVDFYAPGAVPGLWTALADVVFFWLERGVRIFRVDNPHTKPFPFWEWLITEVRLAYPDAIFLAEAFTRPKIMNRLGKIGFHQSYTYFTWRNTKAELQEYLTQLNAEPMRDFFRPNFFVNTPDINPVFLQTSGRAGFLIRAALAATLSGSWGVYCGFELCEAAPVPGKEEYLDSEKYQLRAWDWQRPGNIVAEVTRLNAIRRQHPALWSHLGVSFLPSDDDQVLFFEKATADRSDVLLIAISLDPANPRSAAIELPLWRWGLSDQATLSCRDVVHDTAFTLTGKWQRVALSPADPYTIWHARPQG